MALKRTAFADDIPKARRGCRFPHGCDRTETRLWLQLSSPTYCLAAGYISLEEIVRTSR
jgi:hypothetical protein